MFLSSSTKSWASGQGLDYLDKDASRRKGLDFSCIQNKLCFGGLLSKWPGSNSKA
jgi:hypothetical protein